MSATSERSPLIGPGALIGGEITIASGSTQLHVVAYEAAGRGAIWTCDKAVSGDTVEDLRAAGKQAAHTIARELPHLFLISEPPSPAGTLTAEVGALDGVMPQAKCLIYRTCGVDTDPLTGQELGKLYRILGSALVRSVSDNRCTAVMYLRDEPSLGVPQVGDILITK